MTFQPAGREKRLASGVLTLRYVSMGKVTEGSAASAAMSHREFELPRELTLRHAQCCTPKMG